MLRAFWKQFADWRRKRQQSPRLHNRRLRSGVELLEERRLLSIVWTNRGSDNFQVYGANMNTARSIVDRAISNWNQLVDLDWDGDNNPNTNLSGNLTIRVSALDLSYLDPTTRGSTALLGYDAQGRPTGADISMDDNGADHGWHFGLNDQYLFSALATPFHGTIPGSGEANDFYRTIAHEIGHAVGILTGEPRAAISAFQVAVGEDQIDAGYGLWRFLNPNGQFGVQATLTGRGGGHFYEGPPDPDFPNEPSHPHELLNPGRAVMPPPTTRQLVSDLTVEVLADAYGYNVTLPSQVDTLHVARNLATGQLFVRGLEGDSNDTITLTRVGSNVEVLVNATRELVAFTAINSVAVSGGGGDDTAHFNFTGGDVIPAGNAAFDGSDGTDAVHATGSGLFILANTALTTPFGNITLSATENASLTGGSGPDTLDASAFSGPVTLSGGAGSDLLYGGAGNDSIDGGENDDNLYGGAGNDSLVGGAGDDALEGGTGNDRLEGGANDDTYVFSGGDSDLGDDTITEASGTDLIDFSAMTRAVTIDLSNGSSLQNVASGNLDIRLSSGTSIENVVGSPNNDKITGNSLANKIWGGAGADTIYGGTGADTIEGEAGADRLYGDNNSPYGSGGNDLIVGGDGSDTCYGDGGNDTIYGDDVADSYTNADLLYGDWGYQNDSYASNAGADSIVGGKGNDSIYGEYYGDTISGGEGNDYILADYCGSYGNYGGADCVVGGAGNDTIYGGYAGDTIYGDDVADQLTGNDLLYGDCGSSYGYGYGYGSDYIAGGQGEDTIHGEQASDTLLGGDGRDLIYADWQIYGNDYSYGNDSVVAGSGNDTVWGGGGADTIYGDDVDNLLSGNDLLYGDWSSAYGYAYGADYIVGGRGDDTVYGGYGSDRIYGDFAGVTSVEGVTYNDRLYGDDGDDTIWAGIGTDTVYAGYGNDLVYIDDGAGGDYANGESGTDTVHYNTDDTYLNFESSTWHA